MPTDRRYNLADTVDRDAFTDAYMLALKARGIEVIAVADHNSHEWIDTMVAAGSRHGVAVFPGCEVTTGTGADGIHLVVIGDLGATSKISIGCSLALSATRSRQSSPRSGRCLRAGVLW
jgi:hypothetical protein